MLLKINFDHLRKHKNGRYFYFCRKQRNLDFLGFWHECNRDGLMVGFRNFLVHLLAVRPKIKTSEKSKSRFGTQIVF